MRALWLAFLFVFGACATAKPVPALIQVAREPERPAIHGAPGERITHLHSRIIVRACGGVDDNELADKVEAMVIGCVAHGKQAETCEESACSAIRGDPATCSNHFASR
jgi:hypothetical protein